MSMGRRIGMALVLAACAGCGRHAERLHYDGVVALEGGRYQAAVNLLEQAAQFAGADSVVHYNLGVAYWRSGRHRSALNAFLRAAGGSKDARPLEFAARCQMELGDVNEALLLLEQAERLDPENPRILTAYALALAQAGQTNAAQVVVQQSLARGTEYAPAHYNAAFLTVLGGGDRARAQAHAASFLKLVPAGEYADRLRDFMRRAETPAAASAGRSLPVPAPAAKPPLPDTSVAVSAPRSVTPTPAPAPTAGTQASRPRARDPKVLTLLVAARRAADAQELDVAMYNLEEAGRVAPNDADVLWETGMFYAEALVQSNRAAEVFRRFVERYPDDLRAPRARAAAAAWPASPPVPAPAAVRTVQPDRPAAQVESPRSRARSALVDGLEAYNRADWNTAIARFEQATQMDAGFTPGYYNLGLALRARSNGGGDADRAHAAFARAVQVDGTFVPALYMLGVTQYERKDHNGAVETLNRALRRQPDYAMAHFVLGLVYRDAGRTAVSRTHLARYLELEPGGRYADTARKCLRVRPQADAGSG